GPQLRCRPRSVKKFCEISRGAWTSGPCTVDRVTLALILRMGPTPLNKPRRVASTLRLHGRDVLTTSPRPSLLQPRGAIGAPRAYFVFACTVESVPSFPPHGPPEVPSELPDRLTRDARCHARPAARRSGRALQPGRHRRMDRGHTPRGQQS